MEELTKTQLILLALLVSFITSIATGIVTVTLLDQAPPGVTQTINRVVERTVEKVVPGQAASVVTKETTVVVKEENLIADAVLKNSKSLARISLPSADGKFGEPLGVGIILSADGLVVTDALNLTESKNYLLKNNEKIYPVVLEKIDGPKGLAFLRVAKPEGETETAKFLKPSFGGIGNLRLGQTVIAIGGLKTNTIAAGIISRLDKSAPELPSEEKPKGGEENLSTAKTEILDAIVSSAPFSSDYSGGPLIDVDGFLLAINMKRKDGDFSIPINTVLDIGAKKLENTDTEEAKK